MAVAARLTGRATRRLTAHARQVWETSPFEAVALVRGVYDRLQAAAREGRRAGFRRLPIDGGDAQLRAISVDASRVLARHAAQR